MNLETVADGIETRLNTISGLTVYDRLQETVMPPCAMVSMADGDYDDDFAGEMTVNWVVLVLVSRVDASNAQTQLRGYCAPTGSGSIKAAIEGDKTLGGSVAYATVTRWDQPAVYGVGGTDYVGVEFHLVTGD